MEQPIYGLLLGPGTDEHSLAYSGCALRGGDCYIGGGKYMAYGTDRQHMIFKYMDPYGPGWNGLGRHVACNETTFGGDPDPNSTSEYCSFANYDKVANDGEQIPSLNGAAGTYVNVAYGVDGVFNFKAVPVSGGVNCNRWVFGDPYYGNANPRACYAAYNARQGYAAVANEGGMINTQNAYKLWYAYGANGRFNHFWLSGTGSTPCGNNLPGGDPYPGKGKTCYGLTVPQYLVDEGQWFDLSQFCMWDILYTTGRNGNVVGLLGQEAIGKRGWCNNQNAGGDPDPGTMKRCYGWGYSE
jgi:hypothetical protein